MNMKVVDKLTAGTKVAFAAVALFAMAGSFMKSTVSISVIVVTLTALTWTVSRILSEGLEGLRDLLEPKNTDE